MFQSAGLFRDVSCPYFLYGLCERPYCHFKHSKQEEAKARKEAAQVSAVTKSTEDEYTVPTSALQRTLQDIEQSIQTEKKKLVNNKETAPPDAKKSSSSVIKNKPTGTPEYNPTPLKELKKQRIQGKLGRSKYDLALLDGPSSAGEYDPASNYSTCSGQKSDKVTEYEASSLPDYAKTLHNNGIKRSADAMEAGNEGGGDDDDDDNPLAKIPKFVSVEYTPAIMENEGSDEEPLGEKEDWFSDAGSEKSSASDRLSEHSEQEKMSVDNPVDRDKNVKVENGLPIEFTEDGFVKNTPVKIKPDAEKVKVSKTNAKEKKTDNIFNLFKAEFDDAFEGVGMDNASNTSQEKDLTKESSEQDSCPKVKLKNSFYSSDKNKSKDKSSSSHKDIKAKGSTQKKDINKSEIAKKISDKNITNNHHNHSSKSIENNKHVSKHMTSSSSSSNRNRDQSKHDSSSSRHSHISTKLSEHSNKHNENASKHSEHSSFKHTERRPSVNSSKHSENSSSKNSESSSKHSANVSKHSENSSKSSTHSSKSSEQSSKHSEKSSKHSHSHKSSIHNNINHSDRDADSRNKHANNGSKRRLSSDKNKSSSSSRDKEKSKSTGKKKQIVNLNVDLFGIDSDEDSRCKRIAKANIEDEDMSDLEKYFSDEDPFDECLRIFNEEHANKPSTSSGDKKKQKKPSNNDDTQSTAMGKKRVALKQSDPNDRKKKDEPAKPKPKPSPAQVMMNRYKMMQERALQEEQNAKEKLKAKVRQISAKNAEKITTQTPTPNVAGSSAAFNSYLANKNKKTAAVTATKGGKRKAHTPTVAIEKLKRPVVEISTSSKVPTNVRQRYLNMFIDECLKLCSSDAEAFKRGKEEEEAAFKRCSNKKIYLNIVVHTIKRLRNEKEDKEKQKKSGGKTTNTPIKLSHAAMLGGAQAAKTTFTINRSGGAVKLQEEDFTGADLYKRLQPYVLTEEQLKDNNFPFPHPEKGGMAIYYVEEKTSQKGSTKGYEKLCIRCGRVFEVYPNGKYPVKEECVYHWGKAWKKKIAGSLETRYTCCSGDLASEGCQVAKAHVHETNKKENLSGFMKTIPSSPPIDGDYGVYALDCEMVYTTMGIELARVTVVGADEEPVYETLIQPDNPVVDCNTRFSGITDEDLEDVHTSIRDVQAVLLSLFTAKTILLGHSLESDLTALKLIHTTVVDTSVVFPHRLGRPYKRALKTLMVDFLKKIIQDDVGGHDSQEDAVACLQLMQYRLKEDARKEIRRLST